MNSRIAKYSIAIILLVTFIAASLMTHQSANDVVNVPAPDLTSPQPQATRPASYIPRSEPSKKIPPSQPVPQQVVIQFAPQTTDAERTEYIESIGGTVTESIDSLDTVVVNVSEETAQEPLPESPVVAVSEPDYYVSSLEDLAPINDPRYIEQWALPAIGAPSAWAQLPADAPKVTVAVIDSGICADHPDLAGRIVDGWDFLESDATPQDDFGHGCSVSGVIAANMNDGIGIAGVAPNAQIMPLRVLNASGVGSYSDVAAAIVYATDNGAQVINLSLGGSNPSSTLENAVNYAISKGVIVVAAAGNNGTEGALYPAAYPDVIAVGSVDPNLQHSSFSNYGSQVDIWAPGRDILTTKRDGSYGLSSGTSFAAPYVTGAEAVDIALNHTLMLGDLLTFGPIRIATPSETATITAQPSGTTTPNGNPTQTMVTDKTFIDPFYGYKLLIPNGWLVKAPESSSQSQQKVLSAVTLIENFDSDNLENQSDLPANDLKIQISLGPMNNSSFQSWVADRVQYETTSLDFVDFKYQATNPTFYTIGSLNGYTFTLTNDVDSVMEVDLLVKTDVVVSIGISPANSSNIADALNLLSTLDFSSTNLTRQDFLGSESKEIVDSNTVSLGLTGLTPLGVPDVEGLVIHNPGWGSEAPDSPIALYMPFHDGEAWQVGGSGSFYGDGDHTNSWNDYYATDWNMACGSANCDAGKDVLPVAGGNVVLRQIAPCPTTGFGCYVKIDHGSGITVIYAHLSTVLRDVGGVNHWDVIGQVGSSGNSTAAHLHLSFRQNGYSTCRNNGNQCPNGENPAGQQSAKPSPMNTNSGSAQLNDGYSYTSNNNSSGGGGGSNSCTPGNQVDSTFFSNILSDMNIPVSQFALDAFVKWLPYENTKACWNPLATTLPASQIGDSSCTDTVFNSAGVRNYSSKTCGEKATAITLLYTPSGSGTYYKPIRDMLSQQSFSWQAIHDALLHWVGSDAYSTSLANDWQNLWNSRGGSTPIPPPPSCPQSGGVILYWNNNYDCTNSNGDAGFRLRSSTGWQNVNDGSFNDKASSLRVPSGSSVMLYVDADRGGGKVCYNFNISDFGTQGNFPGTSTGINEQVSSMEVFSDTTCGGASLPSVPSLSSPGNGSSNSYNYNLNFQWIAVPGATSYLVEWWGGPYSTMQPCGWSSSTSCTIGTVAQGNTYSWHVMAHNSYGDSNWSPTWTFTIQTQPSAPPAPTLSVPGNGSSNPYNYDLSFQWNSASGATEYQIEWWGGPYTTMQPCGWSTSTSCHIGTITPGNTYSWHVRARNSYGTSGWSPTWTFSIQNAPLPDLIPYPRPGASDPVAVSRSADYPYTEELISGQTAFFYWGYNNVGQSNAGAHHVKVYVDNNLHIDYQFSGLGTGNLGGFDNWSDSTYVAPGPHAVKIVVDANNEVSESDETNNTWTGTVYWRDPAITLYDVYTTDDLGPAAVGNKMSANGVQSEAYKDTFTFGDPIRLYLWFGSEYTDNRTVSGEWQVINPAGRVVPELSFTGNTTIGSGGWVWWQEGVIPTNSLRGQYTFIGKTTYNGVTSTKTHTFTVTGPPTVEVYDVFVTDENGSATSLEAIPQRAVPSDVGSNSVPTFNAGDSIRLYIDAYNDVVEGESATFEWEVIDPLNRPMNALQWSGDLTSWLGHTWWSLSPTIPSNAITGDYIFTGYITHGDRTTFQSQTFHVNGSAGPSNDSFSSPVVISSVPYTGTKDTWGASTATTDPTPTCGSGKNSNSVWYRYTAPAKGLLEVDTWGSDYDTVIAVWTGTISNLSLVQCNDDTYGYLQARLEEVPVNAGVTYYIEAMDYGGPGGGYLDLYVNFAQTTSNNDFNTPTIINTLPYSITQDTRGTTQANDDPTLVSCNRLPGMASVWYRYTPPVNGNILLDTKGSNYDTLLAVWTGSRGSLVSIGCNDDIGIVNGSLDTDSTLNIPVTAGTTYYIEASTFNGFIDINGASAMELQTKQDNVSDEALASGLQDKKTELDNNGGLITDLQSELSNDVSAQFWGGSLNLHVTFTYNILGNAGVADATLSYIDGMSKTVTTDGSGDYSITVPSGWGGTVMPYKAGYIFTPISKSYTNIQSDQTAQNYSAQVCVDCADVNVLIGGTQMGAYTFIPGSSTRQNYAGVDSGPVKVVSTNGVPIISAMRDAWAVNGVTTSFSQLMGLPLEQLSDTYVFPGYNNVTLNDQLRIANVDTTATSVTVTIGGIVRGTYPLEAGAAVRINYPGLDSGPVMVQGTSGVKIIAAIREAWAVNGVTKSFVQLMGLPAGQLSNKYVYAAYNNVTLNEQLRIGNVDPTQSTVVTVTIGGTVQGTYPLGPGQAVRVNYPGLDSGPVIVEGTAGVNIISSIRDAWAVGGVTTSFSQLMGMPDGQLSDKYVYPGYNNVTLDDQLRIANADTTATTVTVTIGGVLKGTYPLAAGAAVRINYPGLDSGPVVVQGTSGVKIISTIREAWAVNGVTQSFVQLMGLPAVQLSTTYWFPAYNNVTLNEQLRIGMP